MVDYQVAQGNKADVTVFQDCATAAQCIGGFNWNETNEGSNWRNIISYREFDIFFRYNPKE